VKEGTLSECLTPLKNLKITYNPTENTWSSQELVKEGSQREKESSSQHTGKKEYGSLWDGGGVSLFI